MKGQIWVKSLDEAIDGTFVSELMGDTVYQTKSNPFGRFKMLVEPIDGVIKYCKGKKNVECRSEEGIYVFGECYIVDNRSEKAIDKGIRNLRGSYPNVRFEECESEEQF